MGLFHNAEIERTEMKILHVITSLEIGGAQRLLSDLLPLQAKTEDISLLVYERVDNNFERKVSDAGVKIISMDEHNFHNPYVILKMRKIFKEYDVVHAHLFPTIWWASLAARGLKVKMVYTEHSTSNSRRGKWYLRPVEQFMYARYNKIISISQQTQDALCSWLRSDDDRFVVICNGVDTARFASVKKQVIPKSLIMVSRFASSKDQETVIRAMLQIDPEATLRFVGDGENLEHCKRVADELGLSDRIQFLGARSDVAELVAESYIGIQSSNWEGFGLTAVEIMASGKPIIGTMVDGLKQVIEGAGETFHVGNDNELAVRVNYLLGNVEYYSKVSRQCMERASKYDISVMVDGYMAAYKEILQ